MGYLNTNTLTDIARKETANHHGSRRTYKWYDEDKLSFPNTILEKNNQKGYYLAIVRANVNKLKSSVIFGFKRIVRKPKLIQLKYYVFTVCRLRNKFNEDVKKKHA